MLKSGVTCVNIMCAHNKLSALRSGSERNLRVNLFCYLSKYSVQETSSMLPGFSVLFLYFLLAILIRLYVMQSFWF